MDITLILSLLAFLLVIGFVAGIIAGLLGLGGGIVLVPAFYFAFTALGFAGGHVMQVCVATSLATIVVTSMRSLQAHHRKGAVDGGILRGWAPGIVLGALLGVVVAAQVDSRVLTGIFGVLGVLVSIHMALGYQPKRSEERLPQGAAKGAISGLVGFLSVLMGIGGGTFGGPILTFSGLTVHRAVATAAGFGLLISVPSVIGFLATGHGVEGRPPYTFGFVNGPAFLITILMTTISAPIGANLAHRLPAARLKRVFAVFLMLVAGRMLLKAFGV